MENEDDVVTVEVNKTDLKHQLGKLLLATMAGFIAQKLAEAAYDRAVTNRHNTPAEIEQ